MPKNRPNIITIYVRLLFALVRFSLGAKNRADDFATSTKANRSPASNLTTLFRMAKMFKKANSTNSKNNVLSQKDDRANAVWDKLLTDEYLRNMFLALCSFFVFYLIGLGVLRFYRSISNRVRQYQLEYLKHFSMVNDDLYNRLLKSKRKSEMNYNLNASKSHASIKRHNANQKSIYTLMSANAFDPDCDMRSEITNDSSQMTILSLRSSSLEDYKTIINGRQVKARVLYDLESIVRESSAFEPQRRKTAPPGRLKSYKERESANVGQTTSRERRRPRRQRRSHSNKCNNPKCGKTDDNDDDVDDEWHREKPRSRRHRDSSHRKRRISDIIVEQESDKSDSNNNLNENQFK